MTRVQNQCTACCFLHLLVTLRHCISFPTLPANTHKTSKLWNAVCPPETSCTFSFQTSKLIISSLALQYSLCAPWYRFDNIEYIITWSFQGRFWYHLEQFGGFIAPTENEWIHFIPPVTWGPMYFERSKKSSWCFFKK